MQEIVIYLGSYLINVMKAVGINLQTRSFSARYAYQC